MDRQAIAAAFERDGYVHRIPVHSGEAGARVRARFDALEAAEGRERCQIGLVDRHFDQLFVWELATHPSILDAVEAVMGPDILLLATHFFCKYPSGAVGSDEGAKSDEGAGGEENAESHGERGRRERFVAWHQDVTYWGLEPPYALTAWYAVDDSDAGNGCMRVIPGTHGELRRHGTSQREGNLLSINQEVPVTPDEEARAVDLCLKAGEISLHHGMLIHGSNPNRSSRRRCGLTIRYVPPHVRVVTGNSMQRPWRAILLRGEDRFGHFPPEPPPFAR